MKNIFRKSLVLIMTLLIVANLVSCGSKKDEAPEELVLGFVPLMDGDKLIEKVEPLSEVLSEAIGIKVKTFTASSYVGVVEAIGSGQVDFSIISPFAYVLANQTNGAQVILSALNKHGKSSYRSEFVIRKDSGIKSIKDLSGKKIAFVDPSSSSGYIYPGAHLIENGIDIENDLEYVYSGGHDKSLQLLLNKDVDCVAVYAGARDKFSDEFKDLVEETEILDYTDDIPYISVVVRSDMDEALVEKIKNAILSSLNEGEGKEMIVELFGLYGFVPASDEDYESIRKTAEIMNIDLRKQD